MTLASVPLLAICIASILWVLQAHATRPDSVQHVLQTGIMSTDWRVEVSADWDVLGPFPIHAREQHYLSPSFPLKLYEPIDYNSSWPSAYADGGSVGWTKAKADGDGNLQVSFPHIRWENLRATEGWAALQHHTVLRSTLTIYPPETRRSTFDEPPTLLVSLIQGSFFTVIPTSARNHVPAWYSGNIYGLERAPPQSVDLPGLSLTEATTYDLFISGDYEIRLFGDPRSAGRPYPTLSINISVDLERPRHELVHDATHDVVCDFLGDWAFGEALGVGVRSVGGWWTVSEAHLTEPIEGLQVLLVKPTEIAPKQTRILPLKIVQTSTSDLSKLPITLQISSPKESTTVEVTLEIKHVKELSAGTGSQVKASYFYAETSPTAFYVISPLEKNEEQPRPPIIALHGAGVDIFSMPFWVDSLPVQKHSWIVVPSGRTSWGLDWHGPSSDDVWASLESLTTILKKNDGWAPWRIADNTKVVMIGHSNGGQGAWWNAARFPDRILAAVPAAGYVKSQAYIPLTLSRSAHFIDPSLKAILESSLTPDDNDLFMTNLANTPILAVHGGDDDNVPTWHSRELVATIRTWNANASVHLREDQGQQHWYPSILANDEVQRFLDHALSQDAKPTAPTTPFTLTVAVPSESGSLYGWRILALRTPGRLGRINVETLGDTTLVSAHNVYVLSFNTSQITTSELVIDGLHVPISRGHLPETVHLQLDAERRWKVHETRQDTPYLGQPSGRIQRILSSQAAITIVVPDDLSTRAASSGSRLAHDLNVYHRLDASIVTGSTALDRIEKGALGAGNLVVIGSPRDELPGKLLQEGRTPFRTEDDCLLAGTRLIDCWPLATIFLHPHPTDATAVALLVLADDDEGIERAARLIPIRTGVATPDWVVLDSSMDSLGAAGLLGSGLWGRDWSWCEASSYVFD